ncbi:hypothetical protein Hanom_Chr05g00390021 [Helianthus anomalus]
MLYNSFNLFYLKNSINFQIHKIFLILFLCALCFLMPMLLKYTGAFNNLDYNKKK